MPDERRKITVRIKDDEHSTPFSSLIASARLPFDRANIDTEWIDDNEPLPLGTEPRPYIPQSSLGLRILRGKPASSGYAPKGGVLGFLYPETFADQYRGHPDAIRQRALSYAAAHELGHMLFGAHTKQGIMRPRITLDEVMRNRDSDFSFIPDEAPQSIPNLLNGPSNLPSLRR